MDIRTVNTNVETGIHFGVCNGNSELLPEDWFEDFEPVYFDENGKVKTEFADDGSDDFLETEHYVCDKKDFKAEYNSNTNIIMIFLSNNVVKCQPCSPCYPNAGALDSIDDDEGIETYSYQK